MKLYIQELPAPRLYLSVPEAQPLILKSGPPAPELYLEKAKYTKRTGGPGNYRYYYDRAGPDQKPFIPEEQLGFEFNETATSQEIADGLNKIKDVHNKDFLTISEELESQGIAADTKQIGDAFDDGLVKPAAFEGYEGHPWIASEADADKVRAKVTDALDSPYMSDYHSSGENLDDTMEELRWEHDVTAPKELVKEALEARNSKKSLDPFLFLDLSKGGNPNREPAMGQFIGGGAGKAHGQGQTSLENEMKDLLDTLPGDDVEKAKYSKRTGSPGSYKYEYGEGESGGSGSNSSGSSSSGPSGAGAGYSAGQAQGAGYASAPGGGGAAAVRSAPGAASTVSGSSKKDDKDAQDKKDKESKKQSGALSAIGNYFKPLTQASSYKQVPGEIAGAARAAGRYFTGKE